jgi:hypothetical protein
MIFQWSSKPPIFSFVRLIGGFLVILFGGAFNEFEIPYMAASSQLPLRQVVITGSTPDLILSAMYSGNIDSDTANLYLAYALADYNKLPKEYQSNIPWDGTAILMRLVTALRTESTGKHSTEIARIIAPETGISCSGSNSALSDGVSSTHFYVEYGTIGGGLTISDYLGSLETSWTTEVTNFGWAAPPLLYPGVPGFLYHVRIDNLGGGLYGYVSSSGTYAGLVGDNPGTSWNDVDAYASCMVLNRDYSSFRGSPQQALDSTTAHELNHAVQYGYGALTGANAASPAFYEGSAAWMEDEVFDAANDNYHYLWPDFTMPMGAYFAYPYRFWITLRGLTEPYGTGAGGDGEQIMQDFWETISQNQAASANELESLGIALANKGTNLADAYHAYAIAVKFNKPCGGGYLSPYCFEEATGYIATAGQTSVHGSIASNGGSYSGNIADGYALNWVSLPASGVLNVKLENKSVGGILRGSLVCDTGSSLNVTPFPDVVEAGESATLGGYNTGGCNSVVAVLTNQSTASIGMARPYKISLSAPPAASLTFPVGSIDTHSPAYIWINEPSSTWYYLWVNGPNGNVINQWYQASSICSAGTCSVSPSKTLGGGLHTWWVRTWSPAGYGPWSAGMSFDTPVVTTPGAPTLISPSGSSLAYAPTYTWNEVIAEGGNAESAATWYYLWVNGPNGNLIKQWYEAEAVCSGGICSVTPGITLGGGTHIWWVRTWNSAGYGPWSAEMSFSLPIPTAPGAATLISPSGLIGTQTPIYTWNEVASKTTDGDPESAATWYYLWVDGPNGNVIKRWYQALEICDAGICALNPAISLEDGEYTWWVRTWNSAGYGLWSESMTFTVAGVGGLDDLNRGLALDH